MVVLHWTKYATQMMDSFELAVVFAFATKIFLEKIPFSSQWKS